MQIAALFKKSVLLSPWPYRLLRFGIGGLFLWVGVAKLLHPKAFAVSIANYEILPDFLIAPAAIGLPSLEVMAGVALLLDSAWGYGLVFGLLALFMGVLAAAMLRGLDIDCGCFSTAELRERSSLQATFLRDAALTLGMLILLLCRRLRSDAMKPTLIKEG